MLMFKRKKLPYNKIFTFQNHSVNYHIIGEGKPVVFVHGAFTNSEPYFKTLELLGKHYEVYVIDLPGFGGSDVIKGKKHDSDLYADALAAFLKEYKLQDAPIIALSMGVVVTLKAALRQQIKGDLIFIAAPGSADKGWTTRVFANLPFLFRRIAISNYFGRKRILLSAASANTGTQSNTSDIRLKNMSYTSIESVADWEYLKDIEEYQKILAQTPNKITFIYGEHDRMKKYKIDAIKEYIEIPGSGHNIFIDAPEETVKILYSLL